MGDKLDSSKIPGVKYTPIKPISNPKGNIYHAIKKSDSTFRDFGEAYFTSIKKNEVKGWKKHKVMHMNLFVPTGEVSFFLHDANQELIESYKLSLMHYGKLTIPPGIWVAFRGESDNNIILNIASIEHDPTESEDTDLATFSLVKI